MQDNEQHEQAAPSFTPCSPTIREFIEQDSDIEDQTMADAADKIKLEKPVHFHVICYLTKKAEEDDVIPGNQEAYIDPMTQAAVAEVIRMYSYYAKKDIKSTWDELIKALTGLEFCVMRTVLHVKELYKAADMVATVEEEVLRDSPRVAKLPVLPTGKRCWMNLEPGMMLDALIRCTNDIFGVLRCKKSYPAEWKELLPELQRYETPKLAFIMEHKYEKAKALMAKKVNGIEAVDWIFSEPFHIVRNIENSFLELRSLVNCILDVAGMDYFDFTAKEYTMVHCMWLDFQFLPFVMRTYYRHTVLWPWKVALQQAKGLLVGTLPYEIVHSIVEEDQYITKILRNMRNFKSLENLQRSDSMYISQDFFKNHAHKMNLHDFLNILSSKYPKRNCKLFGQIPHLNEDYYVGLLYEEDEEDVKILEKTKLNKYENYDMLA